MGIHIGNKKFNLINHTPGVVSKVREQYSDLEKTLLEFAYKITIIDGNSSSNYYIKKGNYISLPDLKKDNHRFLGYSNTVDGEIYDYGEYIPDSNTTVYAQFQYGLPDFTLNYDDIDIDDNGIITAYRGTESDVVLPSTYSLKAGEKEFAVPRINWSLSSVDASYVESFEIYDSNMNRLETWADVQALSVGYIKSVKFISPSYNSRVVSYIWTFPVVVNGTVYNDSTTLRSDAYS